MKNVLSLSNMVLSLFSFTMLFPLQGQTHLPSKVYPWPDSKGDAEQTLLVGQSTHLEHPEIKAVQWQAEESLAQENRHPDLEELIIVKEGQLQITIGDRQESLGQNREGTGYLFCFSVEVGAALFKILGHC